MEKLLKVQRVCKRSNINMDDLLQMIQLYGYPPEKRIPCNINSLMNLTEKELDEIRYCDFITGTWSTKIKKLSDDQKVLATKYLSFLKKHGVYAIYDPVYKFAVNLDLINIEYALKLIYNYVGDLNLLLELIRMVCQCRTKKICQTVPRNDLVGCISDGNGFNVPRVKAQDSIVFKDPNMFLFSINRLSLKKLKVENLWKVFKKFRDVEAINFAIEVDKKVINRPTRQKPKPRVTYNLVNSSSYTNDESKGCRKMYNIVSNTKRRWVITLFFTIGHSSIIIADTKEKEVIIIDPDVDENTDRPSDLCNAILYQCFPKEYKCVNNSSCDYIAIQKLETVIDFGSSFIRFGKITSPIQITKTGLCTLWSILLGLARVCNPNMSVKEVTERLYEYFDKRWIQTLDVLENIFKAIAM